MNVKLTDDGKFSIKAYNHSNDDQLYKSSLYTQGVGFVYREDFNTFGELGRRFWKKLTRADKRDDKKKAELLGNSKFPTFKDFTERIPKDKKHISYWLGLGILVKMNKNAALATKLKAQGGKSDKKFESNNNLHMAKFIRLVSGFLRI